MTPKDVLKDAREWLSDPEHWCKGSLGSREEGHTCLLGALLTSSRPDTEEEQAAVTVVIKIIRALYGRSTLGFNDDPDTKHEDVLKVLDAAIERAS